MALKLEIQTSQILTNDDEVCILSLSSILLAGANSKEVRRKTEFTWLAEYRSDFWLETDKKIFFSDAFYLFSNEVWSLHNPISHSICTY